MRSEAKILSILNSDIRACNEWLNQFFSSNLREQAYPISIHASFQRRKQLSNLSTASELA
ncbi:hypothetical protein SCHPADRAFT_906482, partial [Schizopora paradoxa]